MSTVDYVVDILLILVIFRQVRPRELKPQSAVLPLVIVVYAGEHYLRAFRLAGNDLALIVGFTLIGAGLGAASGFATRLFSGDGAVLAQAGVVAAATWVAGMGFRFAFAVYANTDYGVHAVRRFSAEHAITSARAWTTALVLMAFGEVLARVLVMQLRRTRFNAAAKA